MTTKGKFMNTNRGSYLLGAALGSALVLALCAPVLAADIYDGGLKGGYDVPPPPPSDRGIYFKGYIGQANPDVGNIWTEAYDTNNFTVHHKDIKSSPLYGIGVGWQARHWLRFDLTGEYRGDAIFVGHDQYPAIGGGDPGTNEYTADIKSWLGLVNGSPAGCYLRLRDWRRQARSAGPRDRRESAHLHRRRRLRWHGWGRPRRALGRFYARRG